MDQSVTRKNTSEQSYVVLSAYTADRNSEHRLHESLMKKFLRTAASADFGVPAVTNIGTSVRVPVNLLGRAYRLTKVRVGARFAVGAAQHTSLNLLHLRKANVTSSADHR